MSSLFGGGGLGMGGSGGPGQGGAGASLAEQVQLMDELQKREEKYISTLEKTLKLRKEITEAGGGGKGGAGGGAGGGEGGGGGGVMAGITATMSRVSQALDFATKGINALGNASLSASQKFRAVAEELPVVGGLIKSIYNFSDAMTGVTEAFRSNNERLKIQMAGEMARGGVARQSLPVEAMRREASSVGAGMSLVSGQSAIGADRSTLAGQRDYERQRALLPLALQQELASARMWGGRAGHAQSQRDVAAAQAGLGQSDHARMNALKALQKAETGGDRGQIDSARTELARASARVNEDRKTLEQAVNAAKERGVALAEKESALRKAGISLAQAELQLAEQKEMRLKGQLQTFGQMGAGERHAAVQAVKLVEEVGWDAAGPWARQQASAVNADRAQQLARRSAEQSGVMDQLPAGWREAGGRMADVEREVAQREARVRDLIKIDEDRLAKDISQAMNEYSTRIGVLFARAVKDAQNAIENQIKAGNNKQ